MNKTVELLESRVRFTPFYFYNSFIRKVAKFYSENKNEQIIFDLIKGEEIDVLLGNYYLDPIALPLIVSLGEQLSKYHNSQPIELRLISNPAINDLLNFLNQSDFFKIVGEDKNLGLNFGKNIFNFNQQHIGGFRPKLNREHHKLRGFSLNDENLNQVIAKISNDEYKRDFLIQHYTFRVQNEFAELLFENHQISHSTSDYIEILAELITNGVLHSKANVYALMFSDRFNVKFSISDNGIGLEESLKFKNDTDGYIKFENFKSLKKQIKLNVSDSILNSTFSIFEALFYSMLKERQGLFDLMIKVVIEGNGYFRIHNENSQLIISKRTINELKRLNEIREKIIELYNKKAYDLIDSNEYKTQRERLVNNSKNEFFNFSSVLLLNYNNDIQYSAVRFFPVKFRGVHIEVEIPKIN